VIPEPPAVKVERAERDSEHDCSPVLRRNVEPTGDAEGPGAGGAQRRPPPAFLVIIAIAALRRRKKEG